MQPLSKPAAPVAAAAAPKPAAPKTGYLAMLERAKAAQEAAQTTGQIRHAKREMISRKERQKMLEEAALAKKRKPSAVKGAGQRTGARTGSRPESAEGPNAKSAQAVPRERKPVDVGYKGTMRPKGAEPSYRGTAQSGRPVAAGRPTSARSDFGRNGHAERYRSYSVEEDDEEEDDEGEDLESDGSDMEAGLDDLEREDREATKIARMEDEEALREENELKRQKMERKRKLEALQAAAAKQKKRY